MDTLNTEHIILKAAEEVFLDKGFAGTKTTDIAEKAGVNHALLHYYFRTKEKLFDTVFENKAIEFLTIFKKSVDKDLPFIKKVKEFVETHFDFIEKMPKVPLFLMREVIANKEKRDFILSKILPLGISAFDKLENLIKTEAEKGHIRQVKALDLMLNIASLNVMTFVLAQVYYGFDNQTDKNLQDFLAQRKLNNVELILRSLQI